MRSFLIMIKTFIMHHKARYFLASIALFFADLMALTIPIIIGVIINQMTEATLTLNALLFSVVLLFFIAISKYWLNFTWVYLFINGGNILEKEMKVNVFHKMIRFDSHMMRKFNKGELMTRATSDLKTISVAGGEGIFLILESTMYFFLIFVLMLWLVGWKLTFITLLPLLLIVIIIVFFSQKISFYYTKTQEKLSHLNNLVLESISGILLIKSTNTRKNRKKILTDQTEEVYDSYKSVIKYDSLFWPSVEVVVVISYVIGITFGILEVYNGSINVGQLVTFNMYLGLIAWSLIAASFVISTFMRGSASNKRVSEVINTPPSVTKPTHKNTLEKIDKIEIKNLSFQYPDGDKPSIKNINMTITRGQTIALVGKIGSGRTTLVKQLIREFPVQEGFYYLNDHDINTYDYEEVRRLISYIPQAHQLFSKSIMENINIENRSVDEKVIREVINIANLEEDINNFDDNIHTKLEEGGSNLSGGQRQRLNIARGLLKNADLLIFDDSLSAVDVATEKAILAKSKATFQDMSVIIIAHRLSITKDADYIYVFDDGAIVDAGTHDELMAHKGWYHDQFTYQHKNGGDLDD